MIGLLTLYVSLGTLTVAGYAMLRARRDAQRAEHASERARRALARIGDRVKVPAIITLCNDGLRVTHEIDSIVDGRRP